MALLIIVKVLIERKGVLFDTVGGVVLFQLFM